MKILVLIEVFVTADARVSFRNPLEKLVAVIERIRQRRATFR